MVYWQVGCYRKALEDARCFCQQCSGQQLRTVCQTVQLYPALVVISIVAGLDKAGSILGDMAATYFVSVAAIVAAFFGKEAYVKSKGSEVKVSGKK